MSNTASLQPCKQVSSMDTLSHKCSQQSSVFCMNCKRVGCYSESSAQRCHGKTKKHLQLTALHHVAETQWTCAWLQQLNESDMTLGRRRQRQQQQQQQHKQQQQQQKQQHQQQQQMLNTVLLHFKVDGRNA